LSYFMGCIWFDVCWCYVAVWLWWCGIRMQAEAVLKPAYVQQLNVTYVCRSRKVQSDCGYGGVVSVCRLKQCLSLHTCNNLM